MAEKKHHPRKQNDIIVDSNTFKIVSGYIDREWKTLIDVFSKKSPIPKHLADYRSDSVESLDSEETETEPTKYVIDSWACTYETQDEAMKGHDRIVLLVPKLKTKWDEYHQ